MTTTTHSTPDSSTSHFAAPSAEPEPVTALVDRLSAMPMPEPKSWWRRLIKAGLSDAERAEVEDLASIRRQFTRPITVMVAQPKGGGGKTPTVVGLSAAFGEVRGGGVVAWDNNELRGTLQDRTYSEHRRDVRDLLGSSDWLMRGDARVSDVQQWMNYQHHGQFWALGSSQRAGDQVSDEDFATVHEIFARYFQFIIVDTGNNERASNWEAAMRRADVLVVPIKWRKDHLIPAARMLETLREEEAEVLADRTVIVGTNGPGEANATIRGEAAQWFEGKHIVEIPTDAHIATGEVIDYDRLAPATKTAYRHLAAVVAELAAKAPGALAPYKGN